MVQEIKLITIQDIQKFRAVSNNVGADRLDPYILEAQELDLKGLLGKDLYLKLFTEVVPNTFPATYEYAALKAEYVAFLVYSTYARFLGQNQVTVTDHSIVKKKNDWSDPIAEPEMQRIVGNARSAARSFGNDLIEYLNDNVVAFPEWKTCKNFQAKKGNHPGRAKITPVNKNTIRNRR